MPSTLMARRENFAIRLLTFSHGWAAGLGLLTPLVALGLVLAYGIAHLHGAPRLFLGYMGLVASANAAPKVIGLSHMLVAGRLRVGDAIVQRLETPRRFWKWVAIEGMFAAIGITVAAILVWFTIQWPASPF